MLQNSHFTFYHLRIKWQRKTLSCKFVPYIKIKNRSCGTKSLADEKRIQSSNPNNFILSSTFRNATNAKDHWIPWKQGSYWSHLSARFQEFQNNSIRKYDTLSIKPYEGTALVDVRGHICALSNRLTLNENGSDMYRQFMCFLLLVFGECFRLL